MRGRRTHAPVHGQRMHAPVHGRKKKPTLIANTRPNRPSGPIRENYLFPTTQPLNKDYPCLGKYIKLPAYIIWKIIADPPGSLNVQNHLFVWGIGKP